ncbi:NACHT domain-containing protein [Nannocystis pusilla]|uniref:NACHT domain-containing protein n=1 Tax=Nannocystis pusilla TaxID=889268 RepID=UPI003DA43C97
MDPMLSSFVFDTVKKLVTSAVSSTVLGQVTDFFKRRRIENAVERAVLAVVEPLTAFLENEKITPRQREILVRAAEQELHPFVHEPSRLFSGSLNGDTMYRQLRSERPLPQEIRDERLEAVYELLVPRMGTVLCSLLPILDEWKTEAWRENFRRFDDVTEMLRSLLGKLDADAERANRETDVLLARVRRGTAQREAFRMDLTALRSDAVISCGFDALFIHPAISSQRHPEEARLWVESESQALETFLAPGARSIIIGVPGAGKSTWLRWLERIGNDVGWSGIVIRIELRRLLRETKLPSYLTLLKTTAGSHLADEVSADDAARWRDTRRLAFLIDGFDEIPSDERDKIHGWFAEMAAAVELCPVILTSRPLTTDHLSRFKAPWRTWTVEPFDQRRIVTYIKRWYEHAELPAGVERSVDADALAQSWMEDSTISPLTSNPLLLATLLLVHVLDGRLPTGRAKLYQRYVDGMLGLWDDRQKRLAPKVALTPAQKRTLLRELALRMFLDKVDQIDEGEATSMVADVLLRLDSKANVSDTLDVLRERTGLLIGPGVYSFSHKTVAEFLVAEAIVDGSIRDGRGERMDRMRLFRNSNQDRWVVVCFLWAGLAPTVEFEQFILDLSNAENDSNSWGLVFGLLRDQAERVSRELWKTCIAKFSGFKVPPSFRNRFNSAALGEYIPAPTIAVRSIHDNVVLHHVLRDAYDKGHFPDLIDLSARVSLNSALQWHVATHPSYGDIWRAALKAPPGWPKGKSWTRVAVSWSFREFLNLNRDLQSARLAELRQLWPTSYSELALVSLWVLSRKVLSDPEIATAIRFLAGIEADELSEARLLRSKRALSPEHHEFFQIAVSAIETAVESGIVSDKAIAERALQCAKKLAERFSLVKFPPKSLRNEVLVEFDEEETDEEETDEEETDDEKIDEGRS